jgi:hypothetical protein
VSKGWLYGLNKLQQLSLAYNKVSTFSTVKLKSLVELRIPDPAIKREGEKLFRNVPQFNFTSSKKRLSKISQNSNYFFKEAQKRFEQLT